MSCQVVQIADCGDISSLARALFMTDKEDTNWLTQCALSLSSCGNLLVVGYKSRLCLLINQWISSTDSNTFLVSWSGTLPADITAVTALPICPSRQSSQNVADWFCIIVGFINGSVGFYTNTGHLLLLEKLDDKPVMKISCHTGTYGILPDDVHILFQSCQCIISGSSLFPVLKTAKAQLAKVLAGMQDDYSVDSRKITIRKWTFCDQEELNDAAYVGLEVKNTYDHMLATSTYRGYDVWYRSIPPISNLILGVGTNPYISFYYALEGGTAPPLQDVARAVAHKIKSALPGWLGGGTERPVPANEPSIRSESLLMRYGLYDSQRHGNCVVVSQDRRLAAVADSFGRVAVVDLAKGHLIRLFKGYRDAQCAFVQIFDDDQKKPRLCMVKALNRAIFLIIYNPKKGLIDIRLMQRGTRVAAFTATKNGQLLYNTCGLVGAEKDYTYNKINLPDFQCVLIDPDGKLKKFVIPFFYALEGEDSQRSKDLHLLRELREHLKRSSDSEDYDVDLIKKASKLKSLDIKKHCIDLFVLKYNVSPKVVIACLDLYWDSVEEDNTNLQDFDIKNYFAKLGFVTLFFNYITGDTTEDMQVLTDKIRSYFNLTREIDGKVVEDMEINSSKETDENEVSHTLSFELLEDDNCILERLLTLAEENNYKDHQPARVTFADDNSSTYKEFVSCFQLDEKSRYISLKSDLSPEKIKNIASIIFHSIFNIEELSMVTNFVNECYMDPKEIVKLLIIQLVSMPLEEISIKLIEKFIQVLYYICSTTNEATHIQYNETSSWWWSIRQILVDMPCPLRTMIVAMACKAVVHMFEFKYQESDEGIWVSLSKEKVAWGTLIGKLQDISILSIILILKASFSGDSLPKLQMTNLNINLNYIYTRGKGSVTELIAKWLCRMGVLPQAVIANELIEKYSNVNVEELDSDDDQEYLYMVTHREHVDENTKIFKWLSLLRQQFPLSTSADYIIANMCWEYAMAWQGSMHNTEYLETVIRCFKSISNLRLRLGMFSIIWSTYIRHTFEVTCRLVNKVGRLPKDPLCLQDVGFDSNSMIKFLEITMKYLQEFFSCSRASVDQKTQDIVYEKIWDDNTPSLVEIAQDMKNVNDDILELNRQISYTIYAICHYNLKISKPLDSLYDIDYQYILEALAGNVAYREINMTASDRLYTPRRKFIVRLIRAAVDTISTSEISDQFGTRVTHDRKEYGVWIKNISLLSELWEIDAEFFMREQVIAMYYRGCDEELPDIISRMREPELLLTPLLDITAQRFKRSFQQSSNQREWIVSVPPHLYIRIRDTEMDTSIPERPSLASTQMVLQRILYKMSRNNKIDDESYIRSVKWARLFIDNCDMLIKRKL